MEKLICWLNNKAAYILYYASEWLSNVTSFKALEGSETQENIGRPNSFQNLNSYVPHM